jgi:pimeloyl-ACP methyl ester carboxylesterase
VDLAVNHRRLKLDGYEVFYREAGAADAPVILLPHGYPCSSYEFRALMPALSDRWRLLAPDFPGCGYSDTPAGFAYDFDGYAAFLARFLDDLGVDRFALYLHDFGSQIGLRLAITRPEAVTALIIQNGDIYQDAFGPKYEGLFDILGRPEADARAALAKAVTEEEFKAEFLNDVRPELANLISPDLWTLHWALMTPRRKEITVDVLAGLRQNLDWFPRYQAYLRDHQPPALILWGPQDGYMPEASARAYLRDLPDAELHLLDGGHWLLEVQLEAVVRRMRPFLERTLGPRPNG